MCVDGDDEGHVGYLRSYNKESVKMMMGADGWAVRGGMRKSCMDASKFMNDSVRCSSRGSLQLFTATITAIPETDNAAN